MAVHNLSPLIFWALSCLLLLTNTGNANSINELISANNVEFVDMTHPFDNETVYWPAPGVQKFKFTKKTEQTGESGDWYAAYEFATAEHGGTHIDAPFHFFRDGLHVGEIPLTKLIVPLIIADITSRVNDDPNFVLHKHHLDYILNDNLGKPFFLIFKFGWSKYFNDTNKYLGFNEQQKKLNFPGISAEVAEWITSSYKNVVGVGVDVPSVDPGSSTYFPVHKILAKAGLYSIENVNLSCHVPNYGCTALVMPMKIAQGTGAPVRLVAICPTKNPSTF